MRSDYGSLELDLTYFVNRQCSPEWHLDRSALDTHNLMFLYAGQCDYRLQNHPFLLQAGDIIYTARGETREASTPPDCLMQCYAINFIVRNGDPSEPILPSHLTIGLDEVLLALFRQLNQVWLEKRPGYLLSARGLAMLILSRVLQLWHDQNRSIVPDQRIEKVRRQIVTHLTDPLQVEQLAALCGLHPVYFGWLFRRQTGQTVKAYINQLRIEKACSLLLSGQTSVLETAEQCGFADPVYFSKVFRRLTGSAPSYYMKRSASGRSVDA